LELNIRTNTPGSADNNIMTPYVIDMATPSEELRPAKLQIAAALASLIPHPAIVSGITIENSITGTNIKTSKIVN
tara:strand:- start:16 stop:240 length:225 start_codon:yes stop_codon:yes gene_type:complete